MFGERMFKKKQIIWNSYGLSSIKDIEEDITTIFAFPKIIPLFIEEKSNASLLLELGLVDELYEEIEKIIGNVKAKHTKIKNLAVVDAYELRALKFIKFEKNYGLDLISIYKILLDNISKLPQTQYPLHLLYFPVLPERELGIEKYVKRLFSALGFKVEVSENELCGAEPFIYEASPQLSKKLFEALIKEMKQKRAESIILSSPLIYHRIMSIFKIKKAPLEFALRLIATHI